jgi:hypothetical protein
LRNLPSTQALTKLLEANFRNAGFDLDRIDALVRQNNIEAQQAMASLLAEAINQHPTTYGASPTVSRNLLRDHVDRVKNNLVPEDASPLLDTANDIVIDPAEFFTDISTHKEAENNRIGFTFDAHIGDEVEIFGSVRNGTASFRFFWQNPMGKEVTINLLGVIGLHGWGVVQSDGGFLFGNRFGHLFVNARLDIRELWKDPPTAAPEQQNQSLEILHLFCDSSGPFNFPDAKDATISGGFPLTYTGLTVPPKAQAIFDITCQIQLLGNQCEGLWDFTGISGSQPQQIECPGVLVTIPS